MSTAPGAVDVVVPDDGSRPTGGSLYDRRLVAALRALGRPARLVPVAGDWPAADRAARARLRAALGEPSSGRAVVLDGLAGCAAPEAVDDAVRRGVPVHLLVHLPLPAETGLDPVAAGRLARTEAAALAAATGVLTTSAWAGRDLFRRYGTADAAVAEPGAFRGPVAAGSTPPRLVCVASLTPRKNQLLLLEALAPLTGLAWTLELAGPEGAPAHGRQLRAAVRDFPDATRVRLRGPLEGPALARLWAGADLLLLPSTAETYGMVVTEALAHGVPALVGAGTGAVEALDGGPCPTVRPRAGAALDPADPAAWTGVLRDWLTGPGVRAQWRAAALARRERLRTWADTARDVLAAVDPSPRLEPRPEHPSDTRPDTRNQEAVIMNPSRPDHPTPDRPIAGDWLALREPADAEAREDSRPLIDRLVQHWEALPAGDSPDADPLVVVDLGAGTGANRAWLSRHLPGPQRWVLLDHDRGLLDRAVAAAREDGADVEPVLAGVEELARVLTEHPVSRRLVTCSALLDLLSREQVEELARVLAERGVPALFALTVDGEVLLDPPHHFDAPVLGAFEDHQHRGELAGTDAVRLAAEALREQGMAVEVTPTPWWVTDQEWARPLLERFLADRADAAVEHRPDLTAEAHAWLRTRLVDCARGRLRATVGHADVLALPPVS